VNGRRPESLSVRAAPGLGEPNPPLYADWEWISYARPGTGRLAQGKEPLGSSPRANASPTPCLPHLGELDVQAVPHIYPVPHPLLECLILVTHRCLVGSEGASVLPSVSHLLVEFGVGEFWGRVVQSQALRFLPGRACRDRTEIEPLMPRPRVERERHDRARNGFPTGAPP
jgi:hypothetical protein